MMKKTKKKAIALALILMLLTGAALLTPLEQTAPMPFPTVHAVSNDFVTSITIPDSVMELGRYPFAGYTNLKTINVGRSVYNLRQLISSKIGLIEDWTFGECSSITDVNVSSENPYYTSQNGVWRIHTVTRSIPLRLSLPW